MTTDKTAKLAAALLADRQRAGIKHNIVDCFSCGHGFVYRGRRDELNGRFCSMRCQDWFDDGNPSFEQQREQERRITNAPLGHLVVIAGPPGVEVGSRYYADIFGDRLRAMKPTKDGFMIGCAHCQRSFESKGLRCCSKECEAEYRKPEEKRKAAPPTKIPFYTVEVTGKAYWRPGSTFRKLGFKNAALGFDSPEARAKAQELNVRAAEVQSGARSDLAA